MLKQLLFNLPVVQVTGVVLFEKGKLANDADDFAVGKDELRRHGRNAHFLPVKRVGTTNVVNAGNKVQVVNDVDDSPVSE